MVHRHPGSCHCGAISVVLETGTGLDDIVPRACSCSFCRKHGASWYSEPDAHLTVRVSPEHPPTIYRFGLELTDFMICSNCGTPVAAISQDDGPMLAVLNVNCLEPARDWSGRSVPIDFDGEDEGERLARRSAKWMGASIEEAQ